MTSILEKGGSTFEGIKLQLCENPLPPLDEAICRRPERGAAQQLLYRALFGAAAPFYRRQCRRARAAGAHQRGLEAAPAPGVRTAGSTGTSADSDLSAIPGDRQALHRDPPATGKRFYLRPGELALPDGTTLAVIVNPNNPDGGSFDMAPLPDLLRRYPHTQFLVDEAFIGLAGKLREQGIYIKPLNDAVPGPGFMHATTALPEDNARMLTVWWELL